MDLIIVRGGKFSFMIDSSKLSAGLRLSDKNPRNSGGLIDCTGMVGKEGALQSLEDITRIATGTITDGFPFPQIFTFPNMIIVCGLKKIYEWDGSSLSLKYTASDAGGTWSAIHSYDYVYMSNGKIAVVRDANSKVYALSSSLPHTTAMCNYNGQVIIGSPDEDGLNASIVMDASPIVVTLTQSGSW